MYEIGNLPYKYSDLEPYIDEATMRLHHTKHHQAYVDKLNAALETEPDWRDKPLDTLLANINDVPEKIRTVVRNHGGGHWNHSFFWTILGKPADDKNAPTGLLAADLEDAFGTIDVWQKTFNEKALGVFGSGWLWLTVDANKKLTLVASPLQDAPPLLGFKPILGVDVWEHAYYLKYQNKRADYLDAFHHVINWDAANKNYKALLA